MLRFGAGPGCLSKSSVVSAVSVVSRAILLRQVRRQLDENLQKDGASPSDLRPFRELRVFNAGEMMACAKECYAVCMAGGLDLARAPVKPWQVESCLATASF